MIAEDVPAKLKHFNAQVAMVPQLSMAGSHGFAIGGQHSCMSSAMDMSSVMDMSARSGDFEFTPLPAAAGSIATDRLTRSARMVRPMLMDQASRENSSAFLLSRSSDDFARFLVPVLRRRGGFVS
jgi:hypothetical protein